MPEDSPWANPDSEAETLPGSAESPATQPPGGGAAPPETPIAPAPAPGGSAALVPIFGLMLTVLIALGVALAVYAQRDTAARYPANNLGEDDPATIEDEGLPTAGDDPNTDRHEGLAIGDDDPATDDGDPATGDDDEGLDDLKAMSLRKTDVPSGLALAIRDTFTNQEWAGQLTGSDPVTAGDPDAAGRRATQLDRQGRVRNLVSFFTWDELATSRQGLALALLAQSTVYRTEEAARADTSRLCGLSINEKDPLTEFTVPRIGDQSTGFTVVSTVPGERKTVDTIVCFRTGRIVHGVVQTSLDGSQDVGLVVSLAERMEAQVALAYAGNPEPLDDDPPTQG